MVTGTLQEIEEQRKKISTEQEQYKGQPDLIRRQGRWIPRPKSEREIYLEREMKRLNELEKITKEEERKQVIRKERQEDRPEELAKAREERRESIAKQKELAAKGKRKEYIQERERYEETYKRMSPVKTPESFYAEYKEVKVPAGKPQTTYIVNGKELTAKQFKEQQAKRFKEEFIRKQAVKQSDKYIPTQSDKVIMTEQMQTYQEVPKGTYKAEELSFIQKIEQTRGRLEQESQLESRPLVKQAKFFAATGLSIPIGVYRTGESLLKPKETLKGIYTTITNPRQAGVALKEQLTTQPAAFIGELVGTYALSYGIVKGVSKLRSTTTQVKIAGFKSETARTASTKKVLDITKQQAQLRSKAVLGKTKTYNVEGVAIEKIQPTTSKRLLISSGKQKFIMKSPKQKVTYITADTRGLIAPGKSITKGIRLADIKLKSGTKTISKQTVELSRQKVVSKTPTIKIKDITENLAVKESQPLIKGKVQGYIAGYTKEVLRKTTTTPTGQEVTQSAFKSVGIGSFDKKIVKTFKQGFYRLDETIPEIRIEALGKVRSGAALKMEAITKLRTPLPAKQVLETAKTVVRTEIQQQTYSAGLPIARTIPLVPLTKKVTAPTQINPTQTTTKVTVKTIPTPKPIQKVTILPKTQTITRIKTTPKTISTTAIKETAKELAQTRQPTMVVSAVRTTPIQDIITVPKTKVTPAQKVVQKQMPKQLLKVKPIATPVPPSFPILPSLLGTPQGIGLPLTMFPGLQSMQNIFKVQKTSKKKYKYRPTVFSISTGFTGKELPGGTLSGLGLRPIKL